MGAAHIFMLIAFIAGALLIANELMPGRAFKHKVVSICALGVTLLVLDLICWQYARSREKTTESARQSPPPVPTPSPLSATPSATTTPTAQPSLTPQPSATPQAAQTTPPPAVTPTVQTQPKENSFTDFKVVREGESSIDIEIWYYYTGSAGTDDLEVTVQAYKSDGTDIGVFGTVAPIIAVNTKAIATITVRYGASKKKETVETSEIGLCMTKQSKGPLYCQRFPYKKTWKRPEQTFTRENTSITQLYSRPMPAG